MLGGSLKSSRFVIAVKKGATFLIHFQYELNLHFHLIKLLYQDGLVKRHFMA